MTNEFQFIDNLKAKYSLERIGDDCAVLPKDGENDLLLTADLVIEDIDFRLDRTTPEFLGHKALAVSLSDIAAMGGEPKWAMLSIGVPETVWDSDFIDRFYEGWFCLAREFNVELVGGDISRVPDKLVIDSVAGGEVARGKAILRSGAKLGDAIFVSGKLGGAAAGLKLLETGAKLTNGLSENEHKLILKQLRPLPHVNISKRLSINDIAASMIDLSDGLSSDLAHICEASKTGARIDNVPIDEGLTELFPQAEAFQMAVHGGEDFELLFSTASKNTSEMESLGLIRIGTVTANHGIIELVCNGKTTILEPKGYRHF